jgi:hypothetical protein
MPLSSPISQTTPARITQAGLWQALRHSQGSAVKRTADPTQVCAMTMRALVVAEKLDSTKVLSSLLTQTAIDQGA